jgi:hypothetical protein
MDFLNELNNNQREAVEYIVTKTVKEWKGKVPDLHKRPTLFILYK